ncbi:hypothetical protein GBA52_016595 [Prunus armeniaca]|nr:hypothetical protein GBA52_016595 [Prunus armeniaca]
MKMRAEMTGATETVTVREAVARGMLFCRGRQRSLVLPTYSSRKREYESCHAIQGEKKMV